MKVKDLKFGINSGECGLAQFCNPCDVVSYKYLLIEKRSSRSYYLYAHQYGHEMPKAYYCVSANADVYSLLKKVMS